jgi:histone deacetylase 1/2
MSTLCTLLSVLAKRGWAVHQIDITTAFLHGNLTKPVYMIQPPSFVDGDNLVCQLKKCLYGLKQSPREWYHVLKDVLGSLGFKPVAADASFWIRKSADILVYIAAAVDDMLVTSESEAVTLEVVRAILDELSGKHSGRARHYNGMCITWLDKERAVLLTQSAHIQKLVEAFQDVADLSQFRSLPMKSGLKLCKGGTSDTPSSELLDVEKYHYRSLLGGLNYISNGTRPDVTYTVNQLSRYANSPTTAHWDVAVDCLRYLNHTITWGIKLGAGGPTGTSSFRFNPTFEVPPKSIPPSAVAFADANHGTSIDDKKSISGMVVQVYGGPVSWASRVQPVASTSQLSRSFEPCPRQAEKCCGWRRWSSFLTFLLVPFLSLETAKVP